MTNWRIFNGDILELQANVLVLSANPQLNLSGGVGGAFLQRYGQEMQVSVHQYLSDAELKFVPRGTVVESPPCGSPYDVVLHAVAIDVFYETEKQVVRSTLAKSLEKAAQVTAQTVAMTALATGYGKMSLVDFASSIKPLLANRYGTIEEVSICLHKKASARELADELGLAVST